MNKNKQIKAWGSNIKASPLYRKLNIASTHLNYKKHLKEIANLKVAVHLHLYYIDLLDEFIENLKNIPINFDLYITLVDHDASDIKKIFEIFPNTTVLNIPNIGRDVGALIEVIRNIKDLSAYDVLIKIHSKKSLHTGQEQKDWRQRLVRTMVAVKNKVLQPCINLLIKKPEWWAVLRICLLLGKVMAKVLTSCAQGLTWKQGKFFSAARCLQLGQ